jgi:hypothetical protein
LEIWGQWIHGDQILGKFKLTYAGQPTLFQGKTSPPTGFDEVKLQILAADQAGNFGLHTLVYKMLP